MAELQWRHVDVFTASPFGGNPAAVILDADGLSDEIMHRVARETNVSDTAFLGAAKEGSTEFPLRWFTPAREVTLCGHATIATAHVLAEEGRLQASGHGSPTVGFRTLSGRLQATLDQSTGMPPVIWLELPVPTLRPLSGSHGPICAALGISPDDLDPDLPVAMTPENDLILPCRKLDTLRLLQPDFAALARIGTDRQVRGFCLATLETVEPPSTLHSRFFAPQYGIQEDPATGSVHGSLALWLWSAGKVPPSDGIHTFVGEQGDWLGRPSRLRVQLTVQDGRPEQVRVGGQAVTLLRGILRLP